MKKKILTLMLGVLLIAVNLYAAGDLIVEGNAGIGTTTPTAKLDVIGDIKGTGRLWLNGATGSTPTSGPGTRLMWIPAKAAFRAGSVSSLQWNNANIGDYSFALGYDTTGSGNYSFTTGYATTASGIGAFASGYNSVASADFSFASGVYITASGTGSFAVGDALNTWITALGRGSVAGGASIVVETANGINANGIGSFAWGVIGDYEEILASGTGSMAVGQNIQATQDFAYAFGKNFANNTANSFAIGFGQIDLLVTGGNVGIGTTTPAYKLDVAGTVNASGGYTQVSDIKFKKDITAIESPLNKILNIKGVSYSFKTDEYKDRGFSEGTHYGVIGQEVEKVLPEVVKESPNGEKTVSYTEIIPVLIEAVKEQQKVIEELKAEVRQLKAKDLVAKSQ